MKHPFLFRGICTFLVGAALSAVLGAPACAAELSPDVNGQNVVKVVCKNGPEVFTFSKVGPLVWLRGEGDVYKEDRRDEWSVYLVRTKGGKGGDTEGVIKAQIDLYTKKVSIFRQTGTVEFTIISASKRKK